MTETPDLIRLSAEHRPLLHDLRSQAEAWLAGKDLEQYNGVLAPKARAHIDSLLDQGEFFGLVRDGQVRAVGALTGPDMDFWTPEEAATPAAYLARFMVADHGKQYGEVLLEALVQHLRTTTEIRLLRLDCWRTNTGLQRYYLRNGFRHIRTVEVPGRMSGALFERAI